MTSNIPSAMSEVTDQWLIEKISGHPDFANKAIKSIERKTVGEGIGQVGEFNQVMVETEDGEQTKLFLKLRAPIEGMHAVAL
ncbi:MAG: hypothetical protein VYB97_06920, partial [Pseudomonadota bacterium]|nr:hypothetical protein [Pseudomonadota bacterium]